MVRPGDIFEMAIWLSGEEMPGQVAHWKTVVCEQAARTAERQNNVLIGPMTFTEKRPGEDRVPPVPDHIHGIDVRLLVAEAKVISDRPLIVKETGFVADLRPEDLARLRQITRRAHAKRVPGDRLSDRNCDQIIEALGPDAAVKTLRENRDGRSLH